MKYLKVAAMFLVLALLGLAPGRAAAQTFGMSVSNSPNPVNVGGTLTYTILITNFSTTGADVFVTNQFSAPVQLISSTNIFFPAGTASNVGGAGRLMVFQLGTSFQIGSGPARLDLLVAPTTNGTLTNIVSVGGQNIISNAFFVTRTVTVTNPTATLGDALGFPTLPVLANDWVTYTVVATNPGANSATRLTLSNVIPAGVTLVSYLPTNGVVTNGELVYNIGTLAAHTGTNVTLTVQPTAAGTYTFISTLFSSSASASATNVLTVGPFDTTQMAASNVTAMGYNPQTGLMNQTIQLSNIGTNSIPASRVVVSGLTNIQANAVLYNAIGTNNGSPFVQFNGNLNPNQSANLVLEYFIPTRTVITIPNSAYQPVPLTNGGNFVSPGGTPFAITRMTNLSSGNVLIEFQSPTNHTYTVIYADNSGMSNALAAVPPIVAQADRTQWIDDGPPKTISAPTNAAQRFYQVIQTQ